MEQRQLDVEIRETRGKGAARRLRRAGLIPGIFYGPGQESTAISLDPKKLLEALSTKSGLNTILNLKSSSSLLDGRTAMLKDYQEKPTESGFIHADLLTVDLDKPIRVEVPVEVLGNPVGVTLGGTLEQMMREVEVECLPLDVPDLIELDVSHLEIGHSVHVSDIKLPENIKLRSDPEYPVAAVIAPRLVEEAVPTAEEAEAEEAKPEEGEAEEKPEKAEKAEKAGKPEKAGKTEKAAGHEKGEKK